MEDAEELDGFKDFTVSSSWERFIAAVESACLEWQNAGKNALLDAGAKRVEDLLDLYSVHTEVSQGQKNYRLEFFFGERSSRHGAEDWQEGLHHLQLWFGVHDFVLIAPVSLSGVLLDAPEATMLLSTVSIALSNCGSSWPVFVPVHDPTRKAYMGIESLEGLSSIKFEADRIGRQVPIKLMHLEGLYDLFMSKLGAAEDVPRLGFTMRLTYATSHYLFEHGLLAGEQGDGQDSEMVDTSLWDDNFQWAEWHSVEDPIKGFELIAVWRSRYVSNSFEMAEFENASTFDADRWMLRPLLTRHENGDEASGFTGRLRRLVQAFVFSKETEFMEDFVNVTKPELEKNIQSCKVPPTTVLDRILKDIFFQAPKAFGYANESARMIKAAPPDSLFGRFCLHVLWFGDCNIRAIAQLWIEFLREVNWCWEERQLLPRTLADETPDFSTCLSQQKLQMLATCIKLRKASDGAKGETSARKETGSNDAELSSSSKKTKLSSVDDNLNIDLFFNNEHRKGSAGPFGNLVLSSSNKPLHVPMTQTPPIMTEDMLEEREHALVALENSPSGKAARIRLQSDILASDMAAFKAANPGAVLEDFVRWHSPRDWIDDDGSDSKTKKAKGKLSRRMGEPGNVWAQIWETAEPTPASEQRPIFDFTREGEKVLHYLETLKPHQLLAHIVSTAFVAATDVLWRTPGCKLQPVVERFDEFYAIMAAALAPLGSLSIPDKDAQHHISEWERDLKQLCAAFEKLEDAVAEAASLRQKLPEASESLLSSIFRCTEGVASSSAPLLSYRDREMVAEKLFSSQSVSETWEESLRMGNFLNGHEPLYRDVLLTCYEKEAVYGGGGGGGGGSKNKTKRSSSSSSSAPKRGCSHRMFACGTADDLQIALSSTSHD
ncbi:rab3 GTPase-activating protein catalytic subunit [Selaginella moellendorffii]|uniref:rab3 GTPase-activating protein catalytic subunit n=1 Tax=Selaginella moellendorffii TaxID=88036 RepID=UPI000D1C778F|nr:rab3 GTPase-activating protein catalytic subunit [Selaginella moellendorffii]|eukprot:XP_024518524.1 rab3 GTPase-activating protein catalytic subunit [Selaginella moellendorffii]